MLLLFVAVIGRNMCREWSFQHTTGVSSLTMACAAVFAQQQHSPNLTTTIFTRSHLLQIFLFKNEIILERNKISRNQVNPGKYRASATTS